MFLIGYGQNVKGYRLYDPIKKNVITSRDVVINEKPKVLNSFDFSNSSNTDFVSKEALPSVGEDMNQDQNQDMYPDEEKYILRC